MTFPKLSASKIAEFELYLDAESYVSRPSLVDLLLGGGMNTLPIVEAPGKLKNAAWRSLNADMAMTYTDESPRKRSGKASQVEAVRAFVKRIARVYGDPDGFNGGTFPSDAITFTAGDEDGTVDIWRTR
jgi:hypothetical protein